MPVTNSPFDGASLPKTPMTAPSISVTMLDPFVSVPAATIPSEGELGMGSCDGAREDSAVICVAPATFACTFMSRYAFVGLVMMLTLTAPPAALFFPPAMVAATF